MRASRTTPLARPELGPLVDELARRFGDGDAPFSVALRNLPIGARHAVADLLGVDRVPRSGTRVTVSRLTEALGMESVADLRAAVESLRGPLPDRRGERLAERAAREGLWSWLAGEAATLSLGGGPGRLGAWVEGLRAHGARGGVDVHRRRLEQALEVLRALPVSSADGVPLAAFAADLFGDPHALDRGRRLSTMVLEAIALATGAPPAADAEAARYLWEAVGVAPDLLSSTVLAIGLPADAPAPLGPWLAAAAVAGEPVVLTLAQLRRWPLGPLPPDGVGYVVENPSLVAEAANRQWRNRPLVCSSGRPTVAVVTLLRQLGAAGACLRQHADFDPTGLAITAWLAERAGTTPWRMTADHYLAAVARSRIEASPLGGLPETPWDPLLRDAMREKGVAVYEEELRADLLGGEHGRRVQAGRAEVAGRSVRRPG